MQQQVAPLDCLAHLAGPPTKGNRGAAALYGGQLLAYAASSAVVVVDVRSSRMLAAVLWVLPTAHHVISQASTGCLVLHHTPPAPSHAMPQVQRMSVATTLAGAHRQAAVSALAW